MPAKHTGIHALAIALGVGATACAQPSSTGSDADMDGGGDTNAADDDGDMSPRFDLGVPEPLPRAMPFGAGTRLAPVVWLASGQELRDQEALTTGFADPPNQKARDRLEAWFDHELEMSCAFDLGSPDRCLPRRSLDYGPDGEPYNPIHADPNCAVMAVRTEDGETPYVRRLLSDELLGVARLGPPQTGTVYSGANCFPSSAEVEYQVIGDDVPLDTFVKATLEVELDRPGRIVPVTLVTEDGAWRRVDAWDRKLGQRVDPTDDVRDPFRWLPTSPVAGDERDDWDDPLDWGTDQVVRADRVYPDPACQGTPMISTSIQAATWVVQRESGLNSTKLARKGAASDDGPAYIRNSKGDCLLDAASCDDCYEIDEERDVVDFPIVESAMTFGPRLGRSDWLASDGTILTIADPDEWYDTKLDIRCRRARSALRGDYYCFPFPRTIPVYADDRCTENLGALIDGRDGPPPPFVGSSAFLTTLLAVAWTELQPGEPVYRQACSGGCTCVPYAVQGPKAYYYWNLGPEIDPAALLVLFDREIMDPRGP